TLDIEHVSNFTSPVRQTPTSTLCPYTTLFRSSWQYSWTCTARRSSASRSTSASPVTRVCRRLRERSTCGRCPSQAIWCSLTGVRSEEHTSELQSRENLVCRLLLEKKKRRNRCI